MLRSFLNLLQRSFPKAILVRSGLISILHVFCAHGRRCATCQRHPIIAAACYHSNPSRKSSTFVLLKEAWKLWRLNARSGRGKCHSLTTTQPWVLSRTGCTAGRGFDGIADLAHSGEKILVTDGGKPWVVICFSSGKHFWQIRSDVSGTTQSHLPKTNPGSFRGASAHASFKTHLDTSFLVALYVP